MLKTPQYAAQYFFEALERDQALLDIKLETVALKPSTIRMMHSYQYAGQRKAIHEKMTANIIHLVLGEACSSEFSTFIDMGMNDGFYAMLASMLGCHVRTVEPQPSCIDRFSMAMILNSPRLPLHVYCAFVGTKVGYGLNKLGSCDGSHDGFQAGEMQGFVETPYITLDGLVGNHLNVTLLHLDTEGAEVDVFRSAEKLIRDGRIQNILVEFKPKKWENFGITREQGVSELVKVFKELKMMCVTLIDLNHCQEANGCDLDVWDPDDPTSFESLIITENDVDAFCTGSRDLKTLYRDIPMDFPSI